MKTLKLDGEDLSLLSETFGAKDPDANKKTPAALYHAGWRPMLTPTGTLAFRDQIARYILQEGERGSAKTYSGLHKLVEHCFLNRNALAIIIVGIRRQAEEGGAWHKLQQEVLPIWKYGNRENIYGQWTENYYDHGLGIHYSNVQSNTAKDVFLFMQNQFDQPDRMSSRILLLSMPVESYVADRVKGMEPSFVLVDEAQTLPTDTYFKGIVQQVGRRPNITTTQQIVYCANPAGPSHWLWKLFWEDPINKEDNTWNPRYTRYHFGVTENLGHLPPDYWANVIEGTKNDPIEFQRMVEGKWVDRPKGKALFRFAFHENLHMRGDLAANRGLVAIKGHPIIVSYDPGAANTSIHFLQIIPTVEKVYKIILDELNFVGEYIPYPQLVPRLIARMKYWDDFELDGKKIGPFRWIHVSDSSAFNQFRAATGSFDAAEIEALSAGKIKMMECPKGPGSIEARTRLMLDALTSDELRLSALCPKTKEMFLNIEEDEKNRMKPKPNGPLVHVLDSASYGFFYFYHGRGKLSMQTAEVTPQSYYLGRN